LFGIFQKLHAEAIVKQGKSLPRRSGKACLLGLLLLAGSITGWTQNGNPKETHPTPSGPDETSAAIQSLQEQVRELREAVLELRSEAAEYRAETKELRRELAASRNQTGVAASPMISSASGSEGADRAADLGTAQTGMEEERLSSLEQNAELLNSKIADQDQTKVESASKYKVRLSGLVLLNLFNNRGNLDNQDFPAWVTPPGLYGSHSFGASLRQSELGLEAFGPQLMGARTSGNLQVDFAGGFPNALNGVNYGLVRLRIASMRMDWKNTSIVAGQDNLFVSPLSPTSFASLAVPAFGYGGNLWGWIPQVRAEHRFALSENENLTLQAGILDNLTGEPPVFNYDRAPGAGERSGQPAYGARVAWGRRIFGVPMTIGTAGYYSRQDWRFGRQVDGWAGMADWDIPFAPRLSLSGEFYRGSAVGGLGGGIGRSVLFNASYTQLRALNSVGGWSQLKFQPSAKLEFNGAFGLDSPYAEDVRAFPAAQSYLDAALVQNRSAFVNLIYRPRSDLLFSAEYRHFRTFEIDNGSPSGEQVNLMMGILF
jgi:hypothetical protein